MIGAKSVASADPDGYTLMFGNLSTLAVLPAVMRDYDPERMFAAVAKVTENYEVLVVHPDFFARSVQELVAYAKANPGKLNYGSAGPGNATHLAAELFRLRTGIDIVHVPYRGAADAVTGVLGGQVQLFFGDTGGVLPLLQEGRLRALAVSSATRNPLVPGVPTMMESGVPDYVVATFIGVVAPAATAPAIIGKLNAAINESLKSVDVHAALTRIGAEVRPASPEEFATLLAAEREKWREVVKLSGIKVE